MHFQIKGCLLATGHDDLESVKQELNVRKSGVQDLAYCNSDTTGPFILQNNISGEKPGAALPSQLIC